MKCPKCGYNSFDHLESCKKCGKDLTEHKAKFNLRGFFAAGQAPAPAAPQAEAAVDGSVNDEETAEAAKDGSVDFGFDFLDEEDPAAPSSAAGPTGSVSLDEDSQSVSIDQPFGADSETIPADTLSSREDDDSDDKPGKGPEFAF
jgi:hypothetical protein